MKVVMISTDRGLFNSESGVSKRFRDYATVFDSLDIIVFTKKGFQKTQIASNVFAYPTNSFSKLNYVIDAVGQGKKLKAGLVSAQDCFLTGLVAWRLAKKLKAKFHLQIHTDIFSEEFKKHSFANKLHVIFAKFLLKKADGIRVVSKRISESLKKIDLKVEPVILPIAVDLEKFNNPTKDLPKKFVYNILTVSRLESEKNVELSIIAFALVAKQRSDVGLTIIGDGSLKDELINLVKVLNISERVNFVGTVSNTEDYYKNSDIYIQSSKYEGNGMTLVEAALNGLAIVTTGVGVVGEVLIDGGNALVSKDDANDFSNQILKVLDDDVLRQSLGDRAKESALNYVQNKEQYLESFKKVFSI